MIIPIRLYGDDCLKEEAYNVELEEGDNITDLVNDLFDTLIACNNGVGLAATQIGIPLRVFVVNHDGFTSEFINPIIIDKSDDKESDVEGCLSIPTVGVTVQRSKTIKVSYSTLVEGELVSKTEDFEGYLARIIQHEIDHLDGICITDKVTGLGKRMIQDKLNIILKGKKEYNYPTLHKTYPRYKGVVKELLNRYLPEEDED